MVMVNQELVAQYKEEGYCVLKNAFDKNVLDSLRSDMLKLFSNQIGKDANDAEIIKLFQKDADLYVNCSKLSHLIPSLHQLGSSSTMIDVMKGLGISFPVINMRPVVFFSSKQLAKHHFYWKSEPHQDYFAMQGSKDSLVVWMPICEMSEELGYLELIPGSHKRGLLNHVKNGPSYEITESLEDSFVPVKMEMGDMLIFSSFSIHRSGTNTSDKIRWAVNFRYNNADAQDYIQQRYPLSFEYVQSVSK